MPVKILNTKSRIFNTALRLFAENGYENVSVRNIADAVGIKAASIYNHYKSKEEILEDCYDFYIEHRHLTRLRKEQYEPIIRGGTKAEVLNVLDYMYPDSIIEKIISSLLIIFSRIYNDAKAKEIYTDEINSAMQYMKDFFNFGIKIGRFDNFNVSAVSLIFLSSRLYAAYSTTIEPGQKGSWQKAEQEVFKELIRIIPFKY